MFDRLETSTHNWSSISYNVHSPTRQLPSNQLTKTDADTESGYLWNRLFNGQLLNSPFTL